MRRQKKFDSSTTVRSPSGLQPISITLRAAEMACGCREDWTLITIYWIVEWDARRSVVASQCFHKSASQSRPLSRELVLLDETQAFEELCLLRPPV